MCKLGKGAEGELRALHKPGVCEAKHTKCDKQNVCKLGKGAEGKYKALHKSGVCEAIVEETGYESRRTSKTELFVLFFRIAREFDGAHEISL